jgi:hypothetical protein
LYMNTDTHIPMGTTFMNMFSKVPGILILIFTPIKN